MKYFVIFILSGLSVQLAAHAGGKHDSEEAIVVGHKFSENADIRDIRKELQLGNSTGLPERDAGDFGPTREVDTERPSTGVPEIKRKMHSDEEGLSIEMPIIGKDTADLAQDFIAKAASMASRIFADYSQGQRPYVRGRNEKSGKQNYVFELNIDTILRSVEKVLKSSMVKNLAGNIAKQMSFMYRAIQDED